MKIRFFTYYIILFYSCQIENKENNISKNTLNTDSLQFGTIQPVLQKYVLGELITRIDKVSFEQKDSINYINVLFYTNKGIHKLKLDQLKEGGNRNAFNRVGIRNKNGPVTVTMVNGVIACPDTSCTLIVDTY